MNLPNAIFVLSRNAVFEEQQTFDVVKEQIFCDIFE